MFVPTKALGYNVGTNKVVEAAVTNFNQPNLQISRKRFESLFKNLKVSWNFCRKKLICLKFGGREIQVCEFNLGTALNLYLKLLNKLLPLKGLEDFQGIWCHKLFRGGVFLMYSTNFV